MSLETEAVLDRRRLRRRASFWRGLAILAVLLAIGAAVGLTADQTSRIGTKQIARVSLEGVITEDRKQLELLRRVADARNVEGLILFINSPAAPPPVARRSTTPFARSRRRSRSSPNSVRSRPRRPISPASRRTRSSPAATRSPVPSA